MSEQHKAIEVLEKHPELRTLPNVLNVGVATKWTTDKETGEPIDTGIPSIVVYVIKKKKLQALRKVDRAPKTIEGVPVDVIELSSDDFALADTKPSLLPVSVQRRLAGGVKK